MEKLIILLLFGVGSALMNWYQQKQKKEQEKREIDRLAREGSPRAQGPVAQTRPQGAAQWAEELRRLLDPNTPPTITTTTTTTTRPAVPGAPPFPRLMPRAQPPPVVVPAAPPPSVQIPIELSEGDLVVKSPLKQSAAAYDQAAGIQQKIEARLKAIDEQTEKHPRKLIVIQRKTRPAKELVRAWKQNPQTLREAFLASIIFERAET